MQSAPENLEVVVQGVEEFIVQQMRDGRRVVLVTVSHRSFAILVAWSSLSHFTLASIIKDSDADFYTLLRRISHRLCMQSGGTTVPLELNV